MTALVVELLACLDDDDELIIVSGPELCEDAGEDLAGTVGSDDRVSFIEDRSSFSFSRRVNLGVAASTGEVVVLLNDDMDVPRSDWPTAMAAAATTPGVGAVGVTLLYEDDTVQHAGLTTIDGLPTHAYVGRHSDDPVDGGILATDRFAWGVTGAALAVTRSNWDRLGGFSDAFPVNYNDVDFCCKASQVGLHNVVLGSVRLKHFETRTRERTLPIEDVEAIRRRWAHRLGPDPLVAGTAALVRESADRGSRSDEV